MAITPEEALKLIPEELEVADRLEKEIDSQIPALVRAKNNTEEIEIHIEIPARIRDEIRGRYVRAGWKEVSYYPPQTRTHTQGQGRLVLSRYGRTYSSSGDKD
jgi:hypothetical protein